MPMSDQTLARKSREDRFKLQQYIEAGLSEDKALLKLFPKDSNRARKLKTWREKGLFPLPDSERSEYNTTVNATTTTAKEATRFASETAPPHETTATTVAGGIPEPVSVDDPDRVAPVSPDTTVSDTPDERLEKIWDLMAERVNAAVAKVVDARLTALTAGFQVAEKRPPGPGRYYKGGKTHTKINVSIPTVLNEALERLGGNRSGHVSNALRLYLGLQNSGSDTTNQ